MVMQSSSFRTPLVQSARFRYRLAPTLPTFHDLTERSADLSPRFAGCDAGIVFSFELGTLPRRYPLFQMQLADFLPCIRRLNGNFLRSFFGWCVSVISPAVRVEFLLNGCSLGLWFFQAECVIQ